MEKLIISQRTTGAEFSILPPQNASGNWVKVVQRVPVKIKIFPNEFYNRLRVGMTVRVSVSTGKVRGLPPQFQFLKDYIFFKEFFLNKNLKIYEIRG